MTTSSNSNNSNNNNSKFIKGVLMKKTTIKEQQLLKAQEQSVIDAWYAANGHLVEEVVEEEIISFDTAEELRNHLYMVDSLRKSSRQSLSAKESDEVVNYAETTYFEDALELNEEDEDFIWDNGGNEAKVERQLKAAILTGDYSRVTKRSSVYEDGGGENLVRATDALHGNGNVFVAAGTEADLAAKEMRITKGYALQLAERYTARRAKEIEMRDFAIERYKYYASLIKTNDDVIKYGETADATQKLVKSDLIQEFGTEYIFMACKYEYKGKKRGSLDLFFHDTQYIKYINPAKQAVKQDERRAKYLEILASVETIPASSPRHVAWLLINKTAEVGINVSSIRDALGYAWDNADVKQFDKQVYFALKQIAA